VAALVWLILCVGAVAISSNQLFFFKDQTGQQILEIWFFGGLGIALLGVGMAIGGLMQSGQKRVFAVVGIAFNGFVLLGGLGLFWASR
jgi:hypothetical protein